MAFKQSLANPMNDEFSIPPRSHFVRHYMQFQGSVGDAGGINNLVRIFNESVKIALASRSLDAALDRRDLAMDAYFQLRDIMPADIPAKEGDGGRNWHAQAQLVASNMLKFFPVYSLANAALGVAEKAAKLKSGKRRDARFLSAAEQLQAAAGCMDQAYNCRDSATAYLAEMRKQIEALMANCASSPE